MKEQIIASIIVVVFVVSCVLYGINFGFGAQCTGMEYSGKEHNLCVKRLVEGE